MSVTALRADPNEYKATETQRFPRLAARDTAEMRYWKKFKNPVVERKTGPVTAIDFCPNIPYDFLWSRHLHVFIFTLAGKRSVKNLQQISGRGVFGDASE